MCNLILIWNMAHIFANNLIKWRKSACESVDLNNNALLVWVVSVPLHFSTCECHNQVIKPFTCLLSKKMWKSYVWTSVMFKRTEVSYLSVAKRIGEEKEKKTFIDCGYCIMNEFGHMNFNDGFHCRFHLLSSENFADIPTKTTTTTTTTKNYGWCKKSNVCLFVTLSR